MDDVLTCSLQKQWDEALEESTTSTKTSAASPALATATEWGFVVLPHCSVVIEDKTANRRKPPIGSNSWVDVALQNETNRADPEEGGDGPCTNETACSHCHLVLTCNEEPSSGEREPCTKAPYQMSWKVSQAGRFAGTLADMVHNNNQQNQQKFWSGSDCSCQRRSDAALLLGAAAQGQDYNYLSVERLQILLLPALREDNEDMASAGNIEGTGFQRRRAHLVVTLGFPNLEDESSMNPDGSSSITATPTSSSPSPRKKGSAAPCKNQRRSIVPKRQQGGPRNKVLPPSVQLLLTLVRSDWDCLDSEMASMLANINMDNINSNEKRKTDIDCFPSKLSLEELYQRIRRSSFHQRNNNNLSSTSASVEDVKNIKQASGITALPVDILQDHIAPFLRARSLDALRCSCKYMHVTLRSVIPGLKLSLYTHQVHSLQWMRGRETRQISEADVLGGDPTSSEMKHKSNQQQHEGDLLRAMTGGQSVWLRPRRDKDCRGIRLDQQTGDEWLPPENLVLARKGARGGLLCDDPGLGKTVTILALILQTQGLTTERQKIGHPNDHLETAVDHDEQIFQAYWREAYIAEYRRRDLCRLVSKIKRAHPDMGYFIKPVDPDLDGCEDYLDVIKQPRCLDDVLNSVVAWSYGEGNSDFDAFVSDVELCFRNAMAYNPEDHEVYEAAERCLSLFRDVVLVGFKRKQSKSARRSFSNINVRPNSSIAALTEQKTQKRFEKALIQSSATLIVIPYVLVEHWTTQIKFHVDLKYLCVDKEPIIFEYKHSRQSAEKVEEIMRLCEGQTHCPLVFVDNSGTQKLPPPEFLAMFSIVITTTKRFKNEWKNGSFQEELLLKRPGNDYVCYRLFERESTDEEACSLLKINWLRLVVDEGHSMGRGKASSTIAFASWVKAERRWAMTGTPTQQTVSQNGLNNMLGLMDFLQHDFFTPRLDGDKVWKRLVAKSWTEGNLSAFFRLKSLLSLLMIRHTKLDIAELSFPSYHTTILPMSSKEVTTYNTLVTAVQANLVLTSMKGSKTSGGQDSLLHRSQSKFAKQALDNIRIVCAGGTLVVPTLTQKYWTEFVGICRHQLTLPQETIRDLEMYLQRAVTEELSPCMCCGMLLSTQLVLPCGHLLCTECMDNETNFCLVCDQVFNVDMFQVVQPGFNYQWKWNLEEEKAKRLEKTTKEVEADTEIDLAHLEGGQLPQGVSGVVALRPAAEMTRRPTKKYGDGHICEYSRSLQPGKCIFCFEPHNHCKLINPQSRCEVCFKKSENAPIEESKPSYIINKLLKLYNELEKRAGASFPAHSSDNACCLRSRPLKVIIFSNFRKNLNTVGDRLLRRFGTACVAEYWGTYRTTELHKFVHDPDCFCMLLGKDGSEGLDLSFVTHIFFLEEVWDTSLQEQVVARAWRMGAKGAVCVETLLAQNSVEEHMTKLEQAGNESATKEVTRDTPSAAVSSATNNAELQRAKVHYLLKNLRLVVDVESVPLRAADEEKRPAAYETNITDEPLPKKRKVQLQKRHVRFVV